VIVLLGNRQPFVQRLVRVLETRELRVRIAQQTEVGRNPHSRPGGPEGTKPLEEKRQRLLSPTLQQHPRPLVKRAQRVPELKPLFGPDGGLFLGRRLDLGPEPAVMVEISRKVHGMAEAKRVADRSGQLARLAINLKGLVRVAKVPQDQREIASVGYAGVV